MSMHYSDPTRADDPTSLPDLEIFEADGFEDLDPGWYYWTCFPGCLPDGEAIGPFDSAAEALADARSDMEVAP